MKTLIKNVSEISIIIFIVTLFFMSGCADDPVTPPKEEEKPKTTATIGSGGGTVGTDDVSITIPVGAFSADHEIAISEVADDGTFGENSVSKPYKIIGIPNDYSKPIRIKMKYTGKLEGKSYVAVGKERYNISTNNTVKVYDLYQTNDSSGHLVCELPLIESGGLSKSYNNLSDEEDIDLEAITKYAVAITNNFIIEYPIFLDPEIEKVIELVEEVAKLIKIELKIPSFRIFINRKILIEIMAEPISWSPDFRPLTNQQFNMSAIYVSEQEFDVLKVGFGRAFFCYELDEGSASDWLYNAISKFLEGLLTDDPNFKYPYGFEQYHMAAFNGLQISNEGEPLDIFNKHLEHGIGMSSVIKYLTDSPHFGKAGIGKMYEIILNSTNPNQLTALLNTVDVPVTDWLPNFFKEYVRGNIYNQPINKFLDNTEGEWVINSVEDTLINFSSTYSGSSYPIYKYQDLSAKMFKINLNYAPPDTSYKMLFSMSWAGADLDGLSMVMFGIKGGEQEYLGTANAQDFEIPNLKSYWDDGMKQFLVVLVNSNITSNDYLGESDIDLTVRVKKKPDYKACIVQMAIPVETRKYFADTGQESFSTRGLPNYYPKAVGSFEENTNTWTGSFNEDGWTGQLIVTLNDNYDMVTNMEFTYSYNDENNNATMGFSFTNIPISSNYWEPGLYSLFYRDDPTLCSHVSNVVYNWQSGSVSTTLYGGLVCDENTWVSIRFDPEY